MSGLESSWPLAANAGHPLKSEVDPIRVLMTRNYWDSKKWEGLHFLLCQTVKKRTRSDVHDYVTTYLPLSLPHSIECLVVFQCKTCTGWEFIQYWRHGKMCHRPTYSTSRSCSSSTSTQMFAVIAACLTFASDRCLVLAYTGRREMEENTAEDKTVGSLTRRRRNFIPWPRYSAVTNATELAALKDSISPMYRHWIHKSGDSSVTAEDCLKYSPRNSVPENISGPDGTKVMIRRKKE
jgi:hypothetical protein